MNAYLLAALLLFTAGCTNSRDDQRKDYATQLADMHKIDVGNGETVYQAEGKNYNFENLSFVITETKPGGGPPLHTHPIEEAHIVLSGTVTYFIDDSVFTVSAPYMVRIPANSRHTFINAGDTVLNLVGVFGQDNFGPYKPVGKNPLLTD
jgi:mannose-6-phosphate isomerase-like protein (cupin superfamily)